ncbi:MAG: hypothetical protein IH631_03185, partial [Candidatus Thorarchaeota archaeon]|nr:hypothetical protein [Candidatus Thorarchaeota archaeon]
MPKGNILGTRPEVDPFEESPGSSFSVTRSSDLNWDDRKEKFELAQPLFLIFMSIVIGFFAPMLMLSLSVLVLLRILLLPSLRKGFEKKSVEGSPWKQVELADTSFTISDDGKHLRCKTPTGSLNLVNMTLTNARSALLGNVSSFVRAVDDANGFCLTVTMRPENFQRALDQERIPDSLEKFFNYLGKGELNEYVLRRGGIWLSHVNIVGHAHDEVGVERFDNAVRASIPMEKWKRAKANYFQSRLSQLNVDGQWGRFFTSGEDLSKWLVQLKSELASEVGSNIPGQFLAPIRGRPSDYRIGVTVNPDTLQTGTPAGLSHSELETGLLLCG